MTDEGACGDRRGAHHTTRHTYNAGRAGTCTADDVVGCRGGGVLGLKEVLFGLCQMFDGFLAVNYRPMCYKLHGQASLQAGRRIITGQAAAASCWACQRAGRVPALTVWLQLGW